MSTMSCTNSQRFESEPGLVDSEGKATGTHARAGWHPDLNVMYNPYNGHDYSWMRSPEDIEELPNHDREFVEGQGWWLKWMYPQQEWMQRGPKWGTFCNDCGTYLTHQKFVDHRCVGRFLRSQPRICKECKDRHVNDYDCIIYDPIFSDVCEELKKRAKRSNLTSAMYREAVAEAKVRRDAQRGKTEQASLDKPFVSQKFAKAVANLPAREPVPCVSKTSFDADGVSAQSLATIRASYKMFVSGGVEQLSMSASGWEPYELDHSEAQGGVSPSETVLSPNLCEEVQGGQDTTEECEGSETSDSMKRKPTVEKRRRKPRKQRASVEPQWFREWFALWSRDLQPIAEVVSSSVTETRDVATWTRKRQRKRASRHVQQRSPESELTRSPWEPHLGSGESDPKPWWSGMKLCKRCSFPSRFDVHPVCAREPWRVNVEMFGGVNLQRLYSSHPKICRPSIELRNRFNGLPVVEPLPLVTSDEPDFDVKPARIVRENQWVLVDQFISKYKKFKRVEVTEAHKSKRSIADLVRESCTSMSSEVKSIRKKLQQPLAEPTDEDTSACLESIQMEYDESWMGKVVPIDFSAFSHSKESITSILDGIKGLQDSIQYLTDIINGVDPFNPLTTVRQTKKSFQKLEAALSSTTRKLRTPLFIGSLVGALISPFAGVAGFGACLGIGAGLELLTRTERGQRIVRHATRLMTVDSEIKRTVRAVVWIGVAVGLTIWSGVTKSATPLLLGIPAGLIADLSLAHGSDATGMAVGLLYHLFKRFVPRDGLKEFDSFLKDCREIGMDVSAKNSLFDFCQSTIVWTIQKVRSILTWFDSTLHLGGRLTGSIHDLSAIEARVHAINFVGPGGRLENFFKSVDACKKGLSAFKEPNKNGVRVAQEAIATCLAEGQDILRVLQMSGKDTGLQNGVRDAMNQVVKLRNELRVKVAMTSERTEPTVVWIAGPAGTGKTTFSQMLMKELVKRDRRFQKRCLNRVDLDQFEPTGVESDPLFQLLASAEAGEEQRELKQEIWTKSGTDKFWTGYTGQRCISWEEAAVESQSSRLEGKNTVAHQTFITDFLQLVSQADFRPQMAAIEDKGTQVNPDFVVVTSNEIDVWTSGDREAVRRRQHIPVLAYKSGAFRSDLSHLHLYVPKRIKCTRVTEEQAMEAMFGIPPGQHITIDCGYGGSGDFRQSNYCGVCGHDTSVEYVANHLPKCEECLRSVVSSGLMEEWTRISPRELADLAWSMFLARKCMESQNNTTDIFGTEDETPSEQGALDRVREVLQAHSLVTKDTDKCGCKRNEFSEQSTPGHGNNCFFYAFRQATGDEREAQAIRMHAQHVCLVANENSEELGYENGQQVNISGAYLYCHAQGYGLSVYIPEDGAWYNDDTRQPNGILHLQLKGATSGCGHWENLVRKSNEPLHNVALTSLVAAVDDTLIPDALRGLLLVRRVPLKRELDRTSLCGLSAKEILERLSDVDRGVLVHYMTPVSAPILANLYRLFYVERTIPLSALQQFKHVGTNDGLRRLVGKMGCALVHPLHGERENTRYEKEVQMFSEVRQDEIDQCIYASCDEQTTRSLVGVRRMVAGETEDDERRAIDWMRKNQKMILIGVSSVLAGIGLLGGLSYALFKTARRSKERAAHREEYHRGLERTRVVDPSIWGVHKNNGDASDDKTEIPFYQSTTQDGLHSWRVGNEAHAYVGNFAKSVLEKIIACSGRIQYCGGGVSSMYCVQLHGNWIMCPAHLVPPIDRKREGFGFKIQIRGLTLDCVVNRKNILFPSDLNNVDMSDVMLINVVDLPMGPKISQYVTSERSKVGDCGVTLSVMPGDPPILTLSRLKVINAGDIVYRSGYEQLKYPGFSCGASTLGPGDCGTLFLRDNKICGMYVAGGLTRSDFIQLNQSKLNQIVAVTNARSEMSCEISEIGPVVDHCFSVTFNNLGRSKLVPSAISDAIIANRPNQPLKVPAALDQEAFVKGLRKFDVNVYPSPNMGEVFAFMRERAGIPPLRSLKTWREAANGLQGGERISKPIDLATSAGLPWVDEGFTKKDLFDADLNPQPQLMEEILSYEGRVRAGVVDSALCFAQLKDELRDRERVEQKKTRIFIANPVHVNMVFRKYLLPFMYHYKKRRDELYHAIGVDPFSDDWAHIASKATGRRCLAVDFSRFDATHPRGLIIQSFDFMASFYENEDDRRMIHNLGDCLANFTYYHRGRAYMATAGQPSGSQVTTVLNSIINVALWLKCWKTLDGSLETFEKNCDLTTFGDDCIFFANSYARNRMDCDLVRSEFAAMGYTITAPNKDDRLEYTSLKRVQFLGRSFGVGPGQTWLPLRDTDLVWSSLCWEHEDLTDLDREGRIRVALAEFAIHSERHKLVSELREVCAVDQEWHRAWSRVPIAAVVNEFRRRVGLCGKELCSDFVGQAEEFEKAIPREWNGIPELDFV